MLSLRRFPAVAFLLIGLSTAPSVSVALAAPPSKAVAPEGIAKSLAALKSDRLFRYAEVGVQVVDLRSGEEVFSHGADKNLNPASTMKIVTAAAALKTLGPSFRYTTDLLSSGRLDDAGVLHGDLYVRGSGDPSMVIEKLWKLVVDLKMHGVEKIDGSVIFDDSYHESQPILPGWNKPIDLEVGPSYFATLSGLSLNFNTAAIVVAPGAKIGGPARVQLETPAGDYVVIDAEETKTGARGSRAGLVIKRKVADGNVRFEVAGNVPAGAEADKYYRTVPEPTHQFMGAFGELLKDQGVEVSGRLKKGKTPRDADLLVRSKSPPIASILMNQNKYSNNFIAEQVLRTLGAAVHGEGSTEKGVEVVRDYLRSIGVADEEHTLVNGSGLSRQADLRPTVLTAVLMDMARDSNVSAEFSASLAIAGRDGTLWRRLPDHRGAMRGKTGTIDGVHCLTGYVDAGSDQKYAFAFLVNNHGGEVRRVRDLHDRMARKLLEFETASVVGENR